MANAPKQQKKPEDELRLAASLAEVAAIQKAEETTKKAEVDKKWASMAPAAIRILKRHVDMNEPIDAKIHLKREEICAVAQHYYGLQLKESTKKDVLLSSAR